MSKYSKPNFFCGECPRWQTYGEPDTTWEDNKKILRFCQDECTAWRTQSGASLYMLQGVYQCWNCIHHLPKYDELKQDDEGVWVAYPFCGRYQEVIHKVGIGLDSMDQKCIEWSNNK